MGLRIQNPLLTLRASNALKRTQTSIARSLERLSTGQRVNSPRDDAHAYTLGVGLTAQIRGLSQSLLGVNTAVGMIETADAAVSTQLSIVQRMRELALEASSETLSASDRSNLNQEV